MLELGPGTGIFTQALLARGIPEERLVLVEADNRFATLLGFAFSQDTHPQHRRIESRARRCFRLRKSRRRGQRTALAGDVGRQRFRPSWKALRLPEARRRLLPVHLPAALPGSPETIDRLGPTAHRSHIVMRNIPPAFVYRIARKD